MLLSTPLWISAGGLLLIGLTGWILYERCLHPAWRKERRVRWACEEAFDEGTYRLVRLRLDPGRPTIEDLFPRPFGLSDVPRYFTYTIEAGRGVEPNYSGMSREDIRLVRHYLHRGNEVPHYGKEVIHPEGRKKCRHGPAERRRTT